MVLGRKTFLSAALTTVAGLASCAHAERNAQRRHSSDDFYAVLNPRDYDYDTMMATLRIRNEHKEVFVASTIPRQSNSIFRPVSRTPKSEFSRLFQLMQLAMNAYDFSLPRGSGTLSTLGVLVGNAIVLGLSDAVWQKYDIGSNFNLANTNPSYRATSNLDPNVSPNDPNGLYQDFSAEAVLKRGGSFMVCHNALTSFAYDHVRERGGDARSMVDDMSHNLLPGFLLVPAGVMAVQLAQEHGWRFYVP